MYVRRALPAAGSDGNKAQHNAQEGMVSTLSAAEMGIRCTWLLSLYQGTHHPQIRTEKNVQALEPQSLHMSVHLGMTASA